MAIVHVLDENTINKIAAGEVVERPASVVKELLENAIDAGSNNIEIEIIDGGTSYIRITDNGIGMEEEDARLSVIRHATSKISSVEDLFDIASLGFRGEALASISSVSKFSLTTRTQNNELGTKVIVNGGIFEDCIPYGCAIGTTIEVRDLFYNTPARKKFLKTLRTEASKIQDIVGKIALSHPDIAFKLIVDGKISIITSGDGDLVNTVGSLYGFSTAKEVFSVIYEGENIFIDGIVAKPSLIKSTRSWQTIIVNNRVISDKIIAKAIDRAYHALLPKGGYPLVVLRLIVPSNLVDINVHPRKNEVKFSDEQAVFGAVYRAILQTLEKPINTGSHENVSTSIEIGRNFFSNKGYTVVDESNANITKPLDFVTETDFTKTANINTSLEENFNKSNSDKRNNVIDLYNNIKMGNYPKSETITYEQASLKDFWNEDNSSYEVIDNNEINIQVMGQVANCYIIASKDDELYIIDQHAAHERVRYDKLCKSTEAIPTQDLLIPIYIQVDDNELDLLENNINTINDLGYLWEQSGPNQVRLIATPLDIEISKNEEIIKYVIGLLSEHNYPTRDFMRHEMLAYASCRGAIKSGHNLNTHQMEIMIKDLLTTDKPYVCPHGRPTIIKFNAVELGKLFLRA